MSDAKQYKSETFEEEVLTPRRTLATHLINMIRRDHCISTANTYCQYICNEHKNQVKAKKYGLSTLLLISEQAEAIAVKSAALDDENLDGFGDVLSYLYEWGDCLSLQDLATLLGDFLARNGDPYE